MPIANIPNFHCCFQSYRHPSRASKTPRSSQHSDIFPPPAQNDYADCSCNCLDPTFKIRGCHHCLSERPVRHRKCWCTRKCPACPCILCNPKLYAAYSSCGLLIRERKCIMESWGLFGSVWVVIEGIWSDLLYGMSSMWKLRSRRATCEDDGNGYLGKQSFTFGLS